jgi:SAM-dependent methyltransferase
MSQTGETTTFKDHFSSHAASYARHRPTYPPQLAHWLAGIAPSRGLALDCGCGTGQFSTLLAREFEQVLATDASASQIAHAEPHERLRYQVAPAERSGLPDASVDLVTVAQAAHWFDLQPFYDEVRRVLRPHGCLALITYGVACMDGTPGLLLRDLHDHVLGPFWPPERKLVESGYRSLPFPFPEIETPVMELRAQWSLEELMGYVDTWSALRQAEAKLGTAPYEEFRERLGRAWGDPAAKHDITWPLRLRVGCMP